MGAVSTCAHAQGTTNCADCKVRMVSVCAALDPEDLHRLELIARSVCFPAKATILAQGEPADAVYNLTSGVARLYKLLPDGRRQIAGFALPGDFLGLAMQDVNGFSVDAIEPVIACRFSRTAYSALVDEKPHLLRRLYEFATHELSLAQDQMVLLGRRTAEEKVIAFLLGMRERWAKLGRLSVHVPLPMGRQDIADSLGITIETASRTITKLARDKTIVVVPDGVRILDLERMERLAAA